MECLVVKALSVLVMLMQGKKALKACVNARNVMICLPSCSVICTAYEAQLCVEYKAGGGLLQTENIQKFQVKSGEAG